jgi:photosystem II stability/assembly factor-like uncharacterized protein
MMTILLATEDGLAIAQLANGRWSPHLALAGYDCQCVTFDPFSPGRAYCGTFDAGLWRSDDGGETWQPTAGDLPSEHVMSVAVSLLVKSGNQGLLWAGTEPSRLFFSEDGGDTWQEQVGLQAIPSRATWSFPPRPWTHHVRWIEPDKNDADLLYVGIELGGVMRSSDGGVTWVDRRSNSQFDCHTLRTHQDAPGLLYEAAGGGFAQSLDGGISWERRDEGMDHHYVYGLAVDPGEPRTLIVSASYGARGAHSNDDRADSHLYRRSGGDEWHKVSEGLPAPKGTRVYILASNPAEAGVFYAATGSALYRSADTGLSWEQIDAGWPGGWSSRGANGLAVRGD